MKNLILLLLCAPAFAVAHDNVADHECRVVLREAHLADCLRGSCNLVLTIDVRSSLNASGPGIFYKTQDTNESRMSSEFDEIKGPQGYRRFVSKIYSPIQAASSTTELIPFVSEYDTTYFDHNVVQDTVGNYIVVPGDASYRASGSICR